jgi:putative ABC transport system permease protein
MNSNSPRGKDRDSAFEGRKPKIRLWLRKLFHVKQFDRELDSELRFHVEAQIETNVRAGMPPEAARQAALREFGGVELAKEECRDERGTRWLEDVWQDVHFGLRMLRKSPGFTAVAILTLALGIGANTVVFSVFYNLMFNAFAAKDASRLVVPVMQDGSQVYCRLSDMSSVQEQNQVFENVIGYFSGFALLRDGLQTYQLSISNVTADAFDFYGVPPLLGRGILREDGKPGAPPVFVINYKTWKGDFSADTRILGKTYTVNGEPRTLVGVMPQRFQAFGELAQLWIPITWTPGMPRTDQEPDIALLARLKPDVSLETASAALEVVFKRLAALHPSDFPKQFAVRGMRANDFLMADAGTVFQSGIKLKRMLYGLLAAVMMLLLIACGNVANLLLARATVREKEMAVRSALGATRGRIIRQLLIESSILAAGACVAGCLFAWVGMKGVEAITQQKVWAPIVGGEVAIALNPPVLFFALVVTLLTTLVSGLAPALHVAREDLQPHLVGSGKGVSGNHGHGKLRAGLVIGEVALSMILLIGAGLMIRSFFLLKHIDMGFNPKNVLLLVFAPSQRNDPAPDLAKATSPQEQTTRREVVERLKRLPGVTGIALQDSLPGYNGGRRSQLTAPGESHAEDGYLNGADEYLFETLGFHQIQGRWLSREEVLGARRVAVVNQRLAHDFFGDGNAVGRQIEVNALKTPSQPSVDAFFQIVGVVGDVKNMGPQQPAKPMAFIPNTIRGSFVLLLKTTMEPASMVHAVEGQIWDVDRDELVGICDPLEDFLQQHTYATPEFGVMISTPLASIGLLLVVVGIFSVMAYTVSLQTHEIGIRMALGAQQAGILKMILAKGVRLIAAGTVIGLFVSYALTRFLASQIWGVSATDPWTFAAMVTLIALVGLVACYIPARRATRVDPMIALRHE